MILGAEFNDWGRWEQKEDVKSIQIENTGHNEINQIPSMPSPFDYTRLSVTILLYGFLSWKFLDFGKIYIWFTNFSILYFGKWFHVIIVTIRFKMFYFLQKSFL